MTSIAPPKNRLWWNQPIEKVELIWITLVFVWGLVMAFMMPLWHVVGDQNMSNETYKTTPAAFLNKTQAMVDQYTVRTGPGPKNFPVVHPPAGSDVYLVARLWDWWPILELEKDQTYRLHLSSIDWQHGFSLQPASINIQVVPEYEHVVNLTPNKAGDYSVFCNEYCGLMHHTMINTIHVVE